MTRVILDTETAPKPSGALDVTVIGHQFWLEFRYLKLGVVTANELHVPFQMSPLLDQRTGAVVMWLVGSLVFLVPAAILTIRLLQREQ